MMRRRVSLLVLGLCATTLAASCVDFDYLQHGGPLDLDQGDASGASDVNVSSDAGDDGGPSSATDADATAPKRFCDGTTHAFCADFDDADPLAAWTHSSIDPSGVVEVSTDRAKSGTHSVTAVLARRISDKKRVTIGYPINGWRRLIVEMDVWLEQPDWQPGDSNAALIAVEFLSNGSSTGAYLSVAESYMQVGSVPNQPMPIGAWVHVRLDVDPASTTVDATVGTESWSSPISSVTAGSSPMMVVSVGIDGFNAPAPSFIAYFDNVTIDLP